MQQMQEKDTWGVHAAERQWRITHSISDIGVFSHRRYKPLLVANRGDGELLGTSVPDVLEVAFTLSTSTCQYLIEVSLHLKAFQKGNWVLFRLCTPDPILYLTWRFFYLPTSFHTFCLDQPEKVLFLTMISQRPNFS